ncbi:MAG: hypothetical protein JW841_13995 [Deltaproteobacteria bacterium]|nr:hypothetical protein [Deltaproteobacteria bacterium]
MTFSTNKKDFPAIIAVLKKENTWVAGDGLTQEIERSSFRINEKKTSMQYKTARQVTTGLVVNKKVNIRREYYLKARSMCQEMFTKREFYQSKMTVISEDGKNKIEKQMGTVQQLEGILSFIYQIRKSFEQKNLKVNGAITHSKSFEEFRFVFDQINIIVKDYYSLAKVP